MESISIKHVQGVAKVLGSVVGVSGALVFALVKGPPLKFINLHPAIEKHNIIHSSVKASSKVEWIKGPLVMITSNIAWSFWLIFQGPLVKLYPAKLRLTTLQCIFSCIQSAIWAVAVDRTPSSWKLGWDLNLLSVAYCGIVVTGITFWVRVWAIEKKGPVFTAMFTPLSLLITAIFSAFLWKETLHWGSVGGAILLVGGLYSVLWGKNKEDGRRKQNQQQLPEIKEETILVCITHDH